VSEPRVLFIPEGLEGERVDAAVARMLGLSRTKITDLIGRGLVSVDGAQVTKSDRVTAGSVLEVGLDSEDNGVHVTPAGLSTTTMSSSS
jgi:23S rRNA pseudouridine1911/1915/1917 synthase